MNYCRCQLVSSSAVFSIDCMFVHVLSQMQRSAYIRVRNKTLRLTSDADALFQSMY